MKAKRKQGRPIDRESKDKIYSLLRCGLLTVRNISDATGMTHHCVRSHLYMMMSLGEVYIVPNSHPAEWGLLEMREGQYDEYPLKQIRLPVGSWKAEVPPIRSVFDLAEVL